MAFKYFLLRLSHKLIPLTMFSTSALTLVQCWNVQTRDTVYVRPRPTSPTLSEVASGMKEKATVARKSPLRMSIRIPNHLLEAMYRYQPWEWAFWYLYNYSLTNMRMGFEIRSISMVK